MQPFFAPGGGLEFFVDGTSPVSIEILVERQHHHLLPAIRPEVRRRSAADRIGPRSARRVGQEHQREVGAAYKKGKKTVYYGSLPKKCPKGGFPLKAVLSFLGGATAEATYKAPCPKK